MDIGEKGFVIGAILAALSTGLLVNSCATDVVRQNLCPALLEFSETFVDSLTVIEEHKGCWTFVHPEAP